MDGDALPYVWHPSPRDRLVARAHTTVNAAIKRGLLPEVETRECMDCGEPAECWDHRNYHHPLAVDPVCKGCNNRRGPGFPFPSETDGGNNKNPLRSKAKGHQSESGDGWAPTECPVHSTVPEDDTVDGVRFVSITLSHEDYAAYRKMTGRPLEYWLSPEQLSGRARSSYFKARDPWRL